jgi:membrane protease YdiL (CAAX protease family)
LQDAENQRLSTSQPKEVSTPREPSVLLQKVRPAFLNEHGLRAGWRFLLFLILIRAVLLPLAFFLLRPFRHRLGSQLGGVVEILLMLCVLAGTYIMARVEGRSWVDYGLSDRTPYRHLLSGILTGFVSLTLMLVGLHLAHFFDFGPQYLHGPALLRAALTSLGLFVSVGIFEETAFRGYPLYTLSDGMGFWPAALLISLLFAYVHFQNPGESPMGIAAVFAFGMMLAFSLWRTGSLLWAMGFHFMWDYSETFIYGVPDSGLVSPQHLLSAKFSGPAWVTGGSVGPEGSALIFIVVLLVTLVIHFEYPARRFEPRVRENRRARKAQQDEPSIS